VKVGSNKAVGSGKFSRAYDGFESSEEVEELIGEML
jgi:hypothetical protein